MRWYWWIVLGILAINALVIVVIGLFLLWDRYRTRGARAADEAASGKSEPKRQGR